MFPGINSQITCFQKIPNNSNAKHIIYRLTEDFANTPRQ